MTADTSRADKLVDAVGLLDDAIITHAKFSRTYARRFITGVAAAALAVLLIPLGTLFFLATRPAGAPAPNGGAPRLLSKEECAFPQAELRRYVNQSVNLSPDATMPGSYYEQSYGANLPEIAYADLERVVFRHGNGVFVYSTKAHEITATYDLEKLGLPPFMQGSVSSWLYVDDLGLYAYLGSFDDDGMNDAVYRLELDLGRAELLTYSEARGKDLLKAPSCLRLLDDSEWQELSRRGIEGHGSFVATVGGKRGDERCLMALNGSYLMKDLQLVILRADGAVDSEYVFEKI